MKTLFKNATVVLPDGAVETSVLTDSGKIVDIDVAITAQADQVIDGTGKPSTLVEAGWVPPRGESGRWAMSPPPPRATPSAQPVPPPPPVPVEAGRS